jgi:protein required for attachment to host cells
MSHSSLTWILAADDTRAHIFAREDGHLTPVLDLAAEDVAEIELTNRTVGRIGSSRTEHHKYEPTMDESRQREIAFARKIAAALSDSASKGKFESLVITAAPGMLGYLRDEIDEHTKQLLVATVSKELANLPQPDLKARLMAILRDPDVMSDTTKHLQ